MNLIEKYLSVFKSHLPQDISADITLELRTNIEEMLDGDESNEAIEAVLLELGDPKVLAQTYNPKPQYLIGPLYYPLYIQLLKIVIPVVISIVVVVTCFQLILTPNYSNIGKVVAEIIGSGFNAGLIVWAWLTGFFALIQYFYIDKNIFDTNNTWDISKLKDVEPNNSYKISRSEEIVSLIFSLIFMVIFYQYPNILGFFTLENDVLISVPIFNLPLLNAYYPIFIIISIFSLSLIIAKLMVGRKNRLILTLTIIEAILMIIIVSIVYQAQLINPNFITQLAEYIPMSNIDTINTWFNYSVSITFVIIVLANVGSIIYNLYLLFKLMKDV